MIVCPRCGKENQDHYKFCLGCGAELPRDAAHQPKSFTAPTPPAGFPAKAGTPSAGVSAGAGGAAAAMSGPTPAAGGARPSGASAQFGGAAGPGTAPQPRPAAPPPAAEPAAAGGMLTCPKCSSSVPPNFKFCGSCGHPMAEVQAAAAAQQAAPAAAEPAPAPTPAAAPAPSAGRQRGSLVLIRPDGTEGDSFPLSEGSTPIGREVGGAFASDSYLSPRHATFRFEGDELVVHDEDSLNGVYFRIHPDEPHELEDGGIFRIGQEILRFEKIPPRKIDSDGVELMGSPDPGFLGRIALLIGRDTYGNAYCIPPEGMHLGRERGDIIFPDDGYVSGLHCRIYGEGGRVMITDVGSSNGTFLRVPGQATIRNGSLLLMGQQLFRVEY